jgi:hypothetical protein
MSYRITVFSFAELSLSARLTPKSSICRSREPDLSGFATLIGTYASSQGRELTLSTSPPKAGHGHERT